MPRDIPLQDIMQNIYIRLHTHYETVRNLDSPVGWLMRVAENACNDELRRVMRFQKAFGFYRQNEIHRKAFEERIPWNLMEAKRLMNGLSPKWETLVNLHYLQGLSVDELSLWSGKKYGAVAKTLVKSMKKMRKNALAFVKVS